MFYTTAILTKKGSLAKIWLAAHFQKRLSKADVLKADIPKGAKEIRTGLNAPLALRLSGQLLVGLVRIYSRKVMYLHEDCEAAKTKIKLIIRKGGKVDLPIDNQIAPHALISLPTQSIEQIEIYLGAHDIDESMFELDLTSYQAAPHEITLPEEQSLAPAIGEALDEEDDLTLPQMDDEGVLLPKDTTDESVAVEQKYLSPHPSAPAPAPAAKDGGEQDEGAGGPSQDLSIEQMRDARAGEEPIVHDLLAGMGDDGPMIDEGSMLPEAEAADESAIMRADLSVAEKQKALQQLQQETDQKKRTAEKEKEKAEKKTREEEEEAAALLEEKIDLAAPIPEPEKKKAPKKSKKRKAQADSVVEIDPRTRRSWLEDTSDIRTERIPLPLTKRAKLSHIRDTTTIESILHRPYFAAIDGSEMAPQFLDFFTKSMTTKLPIDTVAAKKTMDRRTAEAKRAKALQEQKDKEVAAAAAQEKAEEAAEELDERALPGLDEELLLPPMLLPEEGDEGGYGGPEPFGSPPHSPSISIGKRDKEEKEEEAAAAAAAMEKDKDTEALLSPRGLKSKEQSDERERAQKLLVVLRQKMLLKQQTKEPLQVSFQNELALNENALDANGKSKPFNRKTVAGAFYQLLILKTADRAQVAQTDASREITITRGPLFDVDLPVLTR